MPRDEPPILREALPPPAARPALLPRRVLRELLALLLVATGVAVLDAVAWQWHWQAGVSLLALAAVGVGVVLGID